MWFMICRGMLSIVRTLLKVSEEGACYRALLARRANLDPYLTDGYIDLILKLRLLAKYPNNGHFRLTEKDKIFLAKYDELRSKDQY